MSQDNREKLLDAGIELLSEKTFSEISMDLVAERSGFSKPMIYYYFKNKEGYYKALTARLLETAKTMMAEIYDPEKSLRENLMRYARFRIGFVRDNPGIASAFISVITDPNIGLLIDEMQEQFDVMRLEFIDPMFDRAIERGEIPDSVNRTIVMMMLNSVLVSITVKMINKIKCHEEIDPEEVVNLIFDGISSSGEDD